MSGWGGGQGECERRFEVFVKMQNKSSGGGGLGRGRVEFFLFFLGGGVRMEKCGGSSRGGWSGWMWTKK